MHFTDLRPAHWLIRLLPSRLWGYALLARIDRPIGVWLLLLPGWWAIGLAAKGWPDGRLMLLFALGALVMRGAGCTLNDIIDRDLDARVARTRDRPLPGGMVNLRQAVLFLILQLGIGLIVLLQLPPVAMIWGAAALPLVAIYPLMKRVTWLPQFILGLTFNWGALLGWAAVTGQMAAPGFLLYCGAVFWTIAYDTIYAKQDAEDDALAGMKSSARLFGQHVRPVVLLCSVFAMIFFALAGLAAEQGAVFFAGLAAAAFYWFMQVMLWNPDDAADCLRRFRNSRNFGLLLLGAILAEKLPLV